ncbi:MAG TPA: ATP-binding protein [Kofleriaceae bacterium]|nr:ATP-binding protein [Kofleriaceae bacterium]
MRRSLEFTPDASRVLVRSPDGVHVVELTGRAAPVFVPAPAIEELAAVDQQIWIVERGVVPVLRRLTLAGDPIGEPQPLWGAPGEGRLTRLASGGAALWTAAPAGVIASGAIAARLPADCDCVLPVSATRWLVCGPSGVALREPTALRWTTSALGREARVGDGAILFGGRSAVLVVAMPAREPGGEPLRQLVVIGLHNPIIQHRFTLVGVEAVRFAPIRGFALLLAGRRRVLLVDLRFGRIVKEHSEDRDVADLAIDDAAQHLAFRYGDAAGGVVHVSMRDFMNAPERPAPGDARPLPAPELVVGPTEATAAEPAPEAGAPFHRGSLLRKATALAPRPAVKLTAVERSAAILERYRGVVTALVGRAIANSWDQGRLTFAGEGAMPYQTEVAGLIGTVTSLAAGDVDAAEERVTAALATVRAAEVIDGNGAPPLLALGLELELSALARQILLVIAGPSLWGRLARLYGILGNDEGRPVCDEFLVCEILEPGASPSDVARELDRTAPLIRHGLVRVGEGTRPFVALTVDPLVLRMLRGEATTRDLDEVREVPMAVTFDDLLVPAAVKEQIARQMARSAAEARVVVRGRVGSGRHTLLATLAAAAGRGLGVVDAAPYLRDLKGQLEALRTALKRAHLLGLLPCLDGLESLASDDQPAREMIREVVRQHPGPLAIRLPWNVQPPVDPGFIAIDLPPLTGDQRLTCWQTALAAHGLYVREPLELATRYRVGPGTVLRACAQVAAALASDGASDGAGAAGAGAAGAGAGGADGEPPRDVAPDLDAVVRQQLEARLGTTATPVTRLATWSQVVLPPDIQDSLLELIARIKHRRVVYDLWGYDQVVSTSRGVTALFQGGPGTGKTLVASAIASELGMDLYRVDLSRIMSKWIGETEQNLAKLFDAAEDGHAIVLFDEADSLFAKRTDVRTSVDRYANLAVNYLLQRLDSFEGIAILTTNFGTAIDAAFKRRMSFRLTFPFPDEEMRERLWKTHLPAALPVAGDLDLAELARRYRMSGGYIRNATLRAAFLAAEEHTPLTQDHLERAVRAEFREIGKLASSGVLE